MLSTNRHVLQCRVDFAAVKRAAATKMLSGVAKVVGGEPFEIFVTGRLPISSRAKVVKVELEK